jgi:uncharacterized membrane protein
MLLNFSPKFMTPKTSLYITLSAYFALLLLLLIWHGFAFPASKQPWLILGFIIAPLLFPIRGLLKENPYTYAWTSFVIMLYFMHGTVEAWANDEQRIFAIIEIYLSVQVFIGAIYFARLQGRALKEKKD